MGLIGVRDALKRRILLNGTVLPGGVLRVDSFLNQHVDMALMRDIGDVFAEYFRAARPDIVMTIESSGIAPAGQTALALKVPLLICRKHGSLVMRGAVYSTRVHSFTKQIDYDLSVSADFLHSGARVLFVDDFLAMGEAALGALRLVCQAGAELAGVCIVIEKTFQPGRAKLEAAGSNILSLARIKAMDANGIVWA